MTKYLKLTSKGQVTLPKDVRDALNLKAGDVLVWSVVGSKIIVTPKNLNFNDLAGLLGDPPNGTATLGQIDASVVREGGRHAALLDKHAAQDDAA